MLKEVLRGWYAKLAKSIERGRVELISDVILVIATGYFVIQRTTGFSFSEWLVKFVQLEVPQAEGEQPEIVVILTALAAIALVLAVLLKVVCMAVNKFPVFNQISSEPEKIAECLVLVNGELSKHISKCDAPRPISAEFLNEEHALDQNIAYVAKALWEHVRKAVKPELDKRNVFVSIYTLDAEENALKYEIHCAYGDGKVKSRTIGLNDAAYKDYECVKCVNSESSVSYVMNKSGYAQGEKRRYRTMRQYMGCKIEHNGWLYGFLSVEFHKKSPFYSEEEMEDFMEEHVSPFRLLLEYQYLKSHFFRRFSEIS